VGVFRSLRDKFSSSMGTVMGSGSHVPFRSIFSSMEWRLGKKGEETQQGETIMHWRADKLVGRKDRLLEMETNNSSATVD
jgi:hypothetical protein